MANPIVIPIKTTVVIMGEMSVTMVLGISLKSKGNIDNRVKTVAIPNKFKTIRVVSRSTYLSRIIKIIWPAISKVNVVVRIGNQALKSPVRMGYLTHLATEPTVSY